MAKIPVAGSLLTWNSLSVPGRQSMDISGSDVPDIDSTDLDSTSDEAEPGIPVEGILRVVFFHDPDHATYVGMKADRSAKTKRTVKLTLPTGTNKVRTWTNCWIKSLDTSGAGKSALWL